MAEDLVEIRRLRILAIKFDLWEEYIKLVELEKFLFLTIENADLII